MGIIYLLQTREFLNRSIYKIGHSEKDGTCRTNQYPKKSILHLLLTCTNHIIIESKIIFEFKSKYNHKQEFGNEYFEGDLNQMIMDIILIYQNNESNILDQATNVPLLNNSLVDTQNIKDTNIENHNIMLSLYGDQAQFKITNLKNTIKNFKTELYYFDVNTIKINNNIIMNYLGDHDKTVIEVIKINNRIYFKTLLRFFLPRNIYVHKSKKMYIYMSFHYNHPICSLDNIIELPSSMKKSNYNIRELIKDNNPWSSKKEYDKYILKCRHELKFLYPDKYTCLNGHESMFFFYDFINLTNIYDIDYYTSDFEETEI